LEQLMSEPVRCCIDDEPLTPPYRIVGGRAYCERHYAMVNKPHPGFWRASLFQIVLMGALSGLLAWLSTFLDPLDQTTRILVGVFLAIVPSALWIYYFYRQDRLEPEPKTRILAVFLLALILQDFLGRRLIDEWFAVARWAAADTLTSLLASILIVGFTWQAIAYAAVRLIVYDTPEFDERMDGIVYGTVAGLGVATLINLRYVIDNEGVALAPGVIQVTTTALAQASFGGLMGYFMAQAKFDHRPVWWVPLGFTIAAALNGLFSWLISEVSASGLTVDPWRSLLMGLAVALVTFFVLVWLMRRTTEVTLRRAAR
jgi:RsiW-degrading membrane proteinase PrsW (M82 family)